MKLLQTLLSWHRPTPLSLSPACASRDGRAAGTDEPRPGCGWFDSSHELRAGLQVREHAANDAVCAGLPLTLWFELQQA